MVGADNIQPLLQRTVDGSASSDDTLEVSPINMPWFEWRQ